MCAIPSRGVTREIINLISFRSLESAVGANTVQPVAPSSDAARPRPPRARRIMRIASHCVLTDAPCTYKPAVSFVMYVPRRAAVVRSVYFDERGRKLPGRLRLFSSLPGASLVQRRRPSERYSLAKLRAARRVTPRVLQKPVRGVSVPPCATALCRAEKILSAIYFESPQGETLEKIHGRVRESGVNFSDLRSSSCRSLATAAAMNRQCAFLANRSCYFAAININSPTGERASGLSRKRFARARVLGSGRWFDFSAKVLRVDYLHNCTVLARALVSFPGTFFRAISQREGANKGRGRWLTVTVRCFYLHRGCKSPFPSFFRDFDTQRV